jgi:hypothetical protein
LNSEFSSLNAVYFLLHPSILFGMHYTRARISKASTSRLSNRERNGSCKVACTEAKAKASEGVVIIAVCESDNNRILEACVVSKKMPTSLSKAGMVALMDDINCPRMTAMP